MFINIGDPETFGNATWELADDLVKAIEQAFPEEMAQKVLMRNLEDLMQLYLEIVVITIWAPRKNTELINLLRENLNEVFEAARRNILDWGGIN